ncbi:MAG: VOC family protein [Crocinitomicaceae bacterium]
MFTVIYTFKLFPNKTKDFVYNWEELTKLIYQYEKSFGSRLHKISDLNYLAYAQWPDKETWDNSGKNLPPSAQDFSKNMKAACEYTSTDYKLEVISDLTVKEQFQSADSEPKATGIGGVFFKAKNVEKLKQWYADHLGMAVDNYGAMFKSRDEHHVDKINYLQWSLFKNDTNYFDPSKQNFMINYRVQNIEKLVSELRNKGIAILDELATYEYGKFIHILDSEGNKIELWEPIDEAFNL